jgi:DNA-binding NarL/FixJ family response regulator
MNESRKGQLAIADAIRSVTRSNVPPCSSMFQQTEFEKPNPRRRPASDAQILAEILEMRNERLRPPELRSTGFRQVPQRSAAQQQNESEQTNPPLKLSTRQLAAVRWVMQGLSSSDVASRIGTTRQTVNRWKRDPIFAAEVRRLHEALCGKIR